MSAVCTLTVTIFCGCFVVLTAGSRPTIKLSSENDTVSDSLTWKVYNGNGYTSQANVPLEGNLLIGIIHQPDPKDACNHLPTIPEAIENAFALIEDYPSCVVDMVTNVKNAGYKLVIATSPSDTKLDVTQFIEDSGFPAVIVTQKYATYLKEHVVVEDFFDIDYYNAVFARVYLDTSNGSIITIIVVVLLLFGCFAVVSICLSVGCQKYNVSCCEGGQRALLGYRRHDNRVANRQGYSRLDRSTLSASIQQHLARVDQTKQVALGEEMTKRLPTRVYQTGQEKDNSCTICVDDFVDGDILRVLPCEHVFHSQCIDEWLISHSSICPLCQNEVQTQHLSTTLRSTTDWSVTQPSSYGSV